MLGKTYLRWILITVFLVFGKTQVRAQSMCSSSTPFFNVDLTSSPYAIWESPSVVRGGECCGSSNTCVEFIVSLNELAGGIVLEIIDGAIPTGSMTYQANCGNAVPVGDSMCLTGTGPFAITFCKPGGNPNKYRISSFARPAVSLDIHIHAGCSINLWSVGFNLSSISWNSIYPGAPGTYNSWLSCTNQCDTVLFTPGPNPPPFIDFRVSGTPQNACSAVLADTVRVYIHDALQTSISPSEPVVCYDSSSTTISCAISGGIPPYTFLWSNGDTVTTAHLTPGLQWLRIKDQSSCPADTIQFMVDQISQPTTINAGEDIYVCFDEPLIELNALYSAAEGVIWSGGAGNFFPSATQAHVWYQPTLMERLNGQVTLTVTTTSSINCPPASDEVNIHFRSKPITSSILHY